MNTRARVLALALFACAAGCDAPPPPTAPVAQLGPWLQLDQLAVQSADDSWIVTRAPKAWRLQPGPWFANEDRVAALEMALRRPWRSVDTRTPADARALGLLGARRLDVVLHPSGRPPVHLAVGDVNACTWVWFSGADALHCLDGDLRAALGESSAQWRSERVTIMDSEGITAVVLGGVSARREDGVWRRAAIHSAGAARSDDPINALALDRLLRALSGARAEPVACESAPERMRLHALGAERYSFALGGPGARCLSVNDQSAFRVDQALGRLLMRAPRSVDGVALPYLGTPDVAGTLSIYDANGEYLRGGFESFPRALVRAITQLRPSARTGPAFATLRLARPQRTILLGLNDAPTHRILLWWHPEHRAVIARVDESPLFFADPPSPLRAPLLGAEGSPPLVRDESPE